MHHLEQERIRGGPEEPGVPRDPPGDSIDCRHEARGLVPGGHHPTPSRRLAVNAVSRSRLQRTTGFVTPALLAMPSIETLSYPCLAIGERTASSRWSLRSSGGSRGAQRRGLALPAGEGFLAATSYVTVARASGAVVNLDQTADWAAAARRPSSRPRLSGVQRSC